MDQTMAVRLLARLGVTPMDIERIRQTPFPQSVAILDELKARVKTNWKRLAFELHPDRTGNDPVKTEEFKGLTLVRDDFEKLRVEPRPQPMPQPIRGVVMVPFIRVPGQQGPPSYAARPTTTASNTTVNAWHFVVTMRPT